MITALPVEVVARDLLVTRAVHANLRGDCMWAAIALVYHLLSRLLYVVGVGTALWRQHHYRVFTRRDGVEPGFARFRRTASVIMNNDGASFLALCLLSRHTLSGPLASTAAVLGGAVLVVVGAGTKVWAARTLGARAYYWHNFFADDDPLFPSTPGPYRFISNPMYTVGYLPLYGFALVTGSLPALLAAVFDQVAILIFNRVVERPHFLEMFARHGQR